MERLLEEALRMRRDQAILDRTAWEEKVRSVGRQTQMAEDDVRAAEENLVRAKSHLNVCKIALEDAKKQKKECGDEVDQLTKMLLETPGTTKVLREER